MAELGVIEDTLFVPLLGRIYASEHFPNILYDDRALALKGRLPRSVTESDAQTQYTYLASASRSANMDRCIKSFLVHKPGGVIVQLGIGLETTYWRDDDGATAWYGVDLPHVIEYRRGLLPSAGRETLIAGSAFEERWLQQVRTEHSEAPILVTAGGLFYYFDEETVVSLLSMLQGHGDVELVFDTVNKSGMRMLRKKYMKKVGHEDAQMFFYVDSAGELAKKVGGRVAVLAEEPYYAHIPRTGLSANTKVSMAVSDHLGMLKMVHLAL